MNVGMRMYIYIIFVYKSEDVERGVKKRFQCVISSLKVFSERQATLYIDIVSV